MQLQKLTGFTLLTLSLSLPAFAAGKTIPEGKYNIDGMHSKVGFEVPHLVISSVEGKFNKFEGVILVDKNIEKSKVDLSIDSTSIDTGVSKRDDHLKSPDFFDAKKFPKLTFASSKITQKENDLTIVGTLKIKDKSKEVTIEAKYLGEVKDGYGQNKIAFKGKTKISRKEFGLTWNQAVEAGPIVGNKIEISLNIQAAQEVAKAPAKK